MLTVKCPECGFVEYDVGFAPTCGINSWVCPKCGEKVDLQEYTGISYKDASNIDIISEIADVYKEKKEGGE
ncbi:MAG: hypothetical protein ACOC80_07465 [Petrotogales bacterium]